MTQIIYKTLMLIVFLCAHAPAYAQEVYGPIQRERMDGWMVMELFSSQACVFCPKADAQMAEFVVQEKMIALSCHVDYFDVKAGSLAIPACSARQNAYEAALRAGPKYTPQMVINGHKEAVGYKMADVLKRLESAAGSPVYPLEIVPQAKQGFYSTHLPDYTPGPYMVWFILFDKPKTLTVADGVNNGQEMTYYNVVTDIVPLTDWGGISRRLVFDVRPKPESAGFAMLVQDTLSMRIILAGKILF